MHNNKKNEELQSRREFFKKAAKGILPVLAFTVIGSSVFTSCEKDESESCRNNCSGSCKSDCKGSCKWSCAGGSDKYDW